MTLLQAIVWLVWWTSVGLAFGGSYVLFRFKWPALNAWWTRYDSTRKKGRVIHVVTPLGKIQARGRSMINERKAKWQDPKPDYLKTDDA